MHYVAGLFWKSSFLLILAVFCSTGTLAQPIAHQGSIDLTSTDFSSEKAIDLNGEWAIFWEQLIYPNELSSASRPQYVTFPHLWNEDPQLSSFGYATYHLTVLMPELHPPLALTLPDMYSAYTLFINGVEAASNGKVAKNKEDYIPSWLPQTIPIDQFEADTLEFVMHISNFRHSKGGIRLPVTIGSFEFLERERTLEFSFTLLLTGCLFMIGLFFMGLYLFGRHEIPMLYFAFFCFVFSYRIIGTELYPLHYFFPNLPWLLTIKAEYFSLYFSPAIFCFFVKRLYPKETSKLFMYLFVGFFGALSLITIFFPPFYFTKLIGLFFSIVPFFIVYITWIYIKAVQFKREGAGFALASTVMVFAVFIHNLFAYLTIVQENVLLTFSGYFAFFFLQSLILSYRFTNSLSKSRIKAELAAKAKSQFLSTMSHEIRTPLNAVIGLSELLIHSQSEKERKEFATNIKQSGENLLEIINNILDYSKFESLGVEADNEPVQLKELVLDMVRLLTPLTTGKNLHVNFKIDKNIPDWVSTDATHLKQILINLIGNAIKFTAQGSISIFVKTNDDSDRKGDIKFTISDTGSGISNKDIHRLFKSFSQVDASTTRKHGGTGLGLAISKKLVKALGGEIWFDSEAGHGTSFYFTIKAPATSKPDFVDKKKETSTVIREEKNDRLNVLVAEDNVMNQKVIQKILEKNNISADIVTNGRKALESVKMNPYDLVFMDMEMPVMDGIETTREIRKLTDDIKQPIIIALTANAFLEDREKCIEAGMNDFVTKPVSVHVINAMLTKWFP